MIESGNKKEEYREIKKYWIGRLAKCGGRNSYEKTGFYRKNHVQQAGQWSYTKLGGANLA